MLASHLFRISAFVALATAPSARAQIVLDVDSESLVVVGDLVDLAGNDPDRAITSIDALSQPHDGAGLDQIIQVDTDEPDTTKDAALLRNGLLTFQEGSILAEPVGAQADEFGSLEVDAAGNLAWNLKTSNTPPQADEGLYFNTRLVLSKGAPVGDPAVSGQGLTYAEFFAIQYAANGSYLASVRFGGAPGSSDRALVVVQTDGNGNLVNEQIIAREGTPVPGATRPIKSLPTKETGFALNAGGDTIFTASIEQSQQQTLGVIYVNGVEVARDGQPVAGTPGAAINYSNLVSAKVAINEAGDWASSAGGVNSKAVVLNGKAVAHTGEFGLTPSNTLEKPGVFGPIHVTQAGEVCWIGTWDNVQFNERKGVFLDRELVIMEADGLANTSTTDLGIVTTLETDDEAFALSPSGRFLNFEAEVFNGPWAAFRADLGSVELVKSCAGNTGDVTRFSGLPRIGAVGNDFRLAVDNGPPGASSQILLIANTLPAGGAGTGGCGLSTGFGELLVDLNGSWNPSTTSATYFPGFGPAVLDVDVPNDPALIGVSFYIQAVFIQPGPVFTFSEGVKVTVGG